MTASQFHTYPEYQIALDQLMATAEHCIRIYDHDLQVGDFNSKARCERLHDFCLAGGARRIEVLLDDTAYVQNRCPRLMTLLRDFSHVIEIRQTEPDSERPDYGFALGDWSAVLKRFDKDAMHGQFDPDDAASAAMLHQQFDLLWQRAAARLASTTLGLG